MGLHDCMYCDGTGTLDASNMAAPDENTVYYFQCQACEGKGQLEECQCCAYEPLECICGAWDLEDYYDPWEEFLDD